MTEGIKIPQLDPTPGIQDTDLLVTAQGSSDYKATFSELLSYVKENITPAEILQMLLQVDVNGSGINATTLDGVSLSQLTDARSLISGIIPEERLPSGDLSSDFKPGAAQHTFDLPEFIFNKRIRIVVGSTAFYPQDRYITVAFEKPFVSGVSFLSPLPTVICSPECRRDGWNGDIRSGVPFTEVELEAKVWNITTNKVEFATYRENGSKSDVVKVHYMAWGQY